MDLLKVALTSAASVVTLFLLTKLMGNKQLSQLSMFDYIIGISIGSIAAEFATELENPERTLIAMIIYAVIAFCYQFHIINRTFDSTMIVITNVCDYYELLHFFCSPLVSF